MDMVFVKLLNMSISASWLVLVVLALRLLLKKSPKWIHVALWALVAVRLICPVSMESAFSLVPSTQTVPEEVFLVEPLLDGQNATLEIVEPRPNVNAVDVELDTTVSVAQTRHIWWVLLWPVGMVVMALHALISYFRLKRKVSASLAVGNGVFICDYIDTPFILGVIKPKIYLPSAMEPDSAAHVLAHERAHIARKDHWWKPFGYLLLTVYWFNPVLWLAYILLCRDIELACDEKVIREMDVPQKKAYSEALLNCSVSRRHIAACPLAFGEVGVKERVKTVLNYKKPAFWIVLAALLALIVTAVCFLTDPISETEVGPDGALQDPYELNWIYWIQHMGLEHTGTVEYAENGVNRKVIVTYDGISYTISDEKGKRQYGYCVKDQAPSENNEVVEYFFLTDDPEMTAERYLTGKNLLPTEVLYVDRKIFTAAVSYGKVPEGMKEILSQEQSAWLAWYCPESMFGITYRLSVSSVREAYMVNRYDYQGNFLCEFKIIGIPQTILELEDGGFAVFAASEADGLYDFACYDETGNLRWKYSTEEGGSIYVPHLHQKNGYIYCFGTVTPENQSSDIFIWQIEQDGKLVRKIKIGGSDFDDIYRVLETENGFEILGSTQSGDGDLPFSVDGYGVGFRLEISPELEILSKVKSQDKSWPQVGYHNGQPVFSDDPILKIKRKDLLREDVYRTNIFDWEDGYVIIRTCNYGTYPYANPLLSRQVYYTQLVLTGYDVEGNPQWQLAGNVCPG